MVAWRCAAVVLLPVKSPSSLTLPSGMNFTHLRPFFSRSRNAYMRCSSAFDQLCATSMTPFSSLTLAWPYCVASAFFAISMNATCTASVWEPSM